MERLPGQVCPYGRKSYVQCEFTKAIRGSDSESIPSGVSHAECDTLGDHPEQ